MQIHKGRFVLLDGLRGAAACAVMYAHLALTAFQGALPQAAFAVDFFFILSGFVLAHAYFEQLRGGRLTTARFMYLRFLRLYPMMIVGIGLAVGVILARMTFATPPYSMAHLILTAAEALTLIPFLSSSPRLLAYPLIGPEWSLSYEFGVNALFAVAAPFVNRPRMLVATILFALSYVITAHLGYALAGAAADDFFLGLPRVLFGFSAGVLCWMSTRRLVTRLSPAAGSITALALVGFLCCPSLPTYAQTLGVVLLFPAIIVAGSMVSLSGIFDRSCEWFGRVSYPLYIIQWPLIYVCATINAHVAAPRLTPFLMIIEGMFIIAVAAAALYLDSPIRNAIRSILEASATIGQITIRQRKAGRKL